MGCVGAAEEDVHFDLETDFGGMTPKQIAVKAAHYIGMLGAFALLAWVIGVLAALPVYMLVCLLLQREKWWVALLIAAAGGLMAELLFNRLLSLAWPPALLPMVL